MFSVNFCFCINRIPKDPKVSALYTLKALPTAFAYMGHCGGLVVSPIGF